ncbi:hypothetical protein [Desulfosarcina widdelii]|nr:hypothetical protein [Desulfosarcina widdelii]
MKKWIILVACSIVCTAIASFLEVGVTAERQVIYIKGGEPVLVDSINRTGDLVLYTVDGKSGMFMEDDVTSIGSVQVQKKIALLKVLDRKKLQVLKAMGVDPKTARSLDIRLLVFLAALALACAGMVLFRKTAVLVKQSFPKSEPRSDLQPEAQTANLFAQDSHESSDLRDIAMFFLELYKLQKGVGKDAPARFSMASDSAAKKMKRFELGVKGSNDWLTRRMSIGPLGEDTGSKSKCYYVIYDTHMVVKIPPTPITDMEKYVSAIRREVQIAVQLAPIACIIPMVSVVLNKVKTLPCISDCTQEQIEKQYIRLVEGEPEYRQYLKIGDRFAFFMELTNSFFLGRVIAELHESKNKVADEFREAPEVPWDQDAFTTRYGLDAMPVFEGLQTLYRQCENEAKRIFQASGTSEPVHTFQIKHWFLNCLAGEAIGHDEKEVDADLLQRVETGFTGVLKKHPQEVEDLNQLLKTQLARKGFSQSRLQIENIASNLLHLLDQLKEKHIALRDLKPDNLFLDANPDDYPVFLNNAESFAIGVIDVETAISLVPDQNGYVAQPLLGGTPLYATPLHVLKNGTIASHFGDVAELLHLQDWFATIAIIFKAVSGRNLFRRSARSFPAVLKILKSGPSKSDPDEATVKAMSRKFWSAAAKDIKTSLTEFSDLLNQLSLAVPEAMVPAMSAELKREAACLDAAIRKHVSYSPLFKSEKNKKFLLEASSDTIAKQIAKWDNAQSLPDHHRKVAPQMVSFLRNLNRLKSGAVEKREAIANIEVPPHGVSAYSILEAMFQITFRAMYKSQWKSLPSPNGEMPEKAALEENRSLVTTIINDN